MSETFKERFHAALLQYVQQFRPEAAEVVGWEDSAYETGGCPSCSYTDYEVTIYFRDAQGKAGNYCYTGKFTHLLEELTS